MKTVYILRHAKAERVSASGQDFDRALTERGERDARAIGKALGKINGTIDHVFCSPAERARQTAELVAEKCPIRDPIDFVPNLYLAEPPTLLRHLVEAKDDATDSLMFVGHNPGLEEFVAQLSTGSLHGVRLPTSGVARIDFEIDSWKHCSPRIGKLIWLVNPEVVHAL